MHGSEAMYLGNLSDLVIGLGNLCFVSLVGQESLPTFENLEVGLSDIGLVVISEAVAKTGDGNSKLC
jgi:hypothetical protein